MTESWKQFEGQVVDAKFPLLQYLAGGEYHAVFLTEHGERKAAIKIVAGGSSGAERKLRQWRLAAKLSHPHLIRLFAMGSSQVAATPVVYVVMEYADEDLSQVIPQRPLTSEETREMLGPALGALAYVHSQGFAHGHLKLSNFMAVGSSLKISSDVGPDASPADDVRSLGMTLLEALTQRVDPAAADTLPAPFAEIVHNCLLEDPKSRWTVDEIASRLRTTTKQPAASRLGTYLWAAVLALILAAVIAGPKLLTRRQEPPTQALVVQPQAPPVPVAPPPETKPAQVPVVKTEQAKTEQAQPEPPPPVTAPPPASPVASPDATTAGVVRRALPQVPSKALRTIHGKVKVSVRVEAASDGSVASAEIDSPGPSQYFAQFALDAARRWNFEPSAGQWILHFEFTNKGVTATAIRATR